MKNQNQETDELVAELRALRRKGSELAAKMRDLLADFEANDAKLEATLKRAEDARSAGSSTSR